MISEITIIATEVRWYDEDFVDEDTGEVVSIKRTTPSSEPFIIKLPYIPRGATKADQIEIANLYFKSKGLDIKAIEMPNKSKLNDILEGKSRKYPVIVHKTIEDYEPKRSTKKKVSRK